MGFMLSNARPRAFKVLRWEHWGLGMPDVFFKREFDRLFQRKQSSLPPCLVELDVAETCLDSRDGAVVVGTSCRHHDRTRCFLQPAPAPAGANLNPRRTERGRLLPASGDSDLRPMLTRKSPRLPSRTMLRQATRPPRRAPP